MKLSPRDAPAHFARPNPEAAGLLVYGPDAMRIALRRQEVIRALIGPQGQEEMRLTRMAASDARKDPARILDAVKAVSFFPGPRAVLVEDATDQTSSPILAALEDWQPGDAQLIVTAGQLRAGSKLRKAFETHRSALATGIYDDPPDRDEIERTLRSAGLSTPDREIMTLLTDLAKSLDPGDFRQTMDKLSLYKLEDDTALTAQDIEACTPVSVEAGLDDILHVVAESRSQEIGPLLRRLQSQGMNPVTLIISATRHFRTLYTAAADPGGASQGIARMRPPVFGPRRDRMLRQATAWNVDKLEMALTVLADTDLKLRSAGQTAPQMALVERALIRLAMLNAAR